MPFNSPVFLNKYFVFYIALYTERICNILHHTTSFLPFLSLEITKAYEYSLYIALYTFMFLSFFFFTLFMAFVFYNHDLILTERGTYVYIKV